MTMTIKHFKNIADKDALRKEYLKLMKKFHPDLGGDLETCKEIVNEYEYLCSKYNTQEYTKTNSQTYYSDADIWDSKLAEILKELVKFETLTIEVIGFWIWVTGDTYSYKEELKEMGFLFSGKKKSWYYNPDSKGKKVFYAKYKNLDEIRNKWGSQKVETEKKGKLGV